MAYPNQAVVVWNVCGMNNPPKRNAMNNAISSLGASVVCLQETKIQDMDLTLLRHYLGPTFDQFFYAPAVGTRVVSYWHASPHARNCRTLTS